MKVALAYSGGLDTSIAARSLAEDQGAEVVAVAVDVGQPIDREALRARADAAGAELVVVGAREAFVTDYCWPALQANALYEGTYPLVSSLARPLIAEKVVEAARRAGADAVAHGCTGKGNDQVRFETTFAALAPDLRVLAPRTSGGAPSSADCWRIRGPSRPRTPSPSPRIPGTPRTSPGRSTRSPRRWPSSPPTGTWRTSPWSGTWPTRRRAWSGGGPSSPTTGTGTAPSMPRSGPSSPRPRTG